MERAHSHGWSSTEDSLLLSIIEQHLLKTNASRINSSVVWNAIAIQLNATYHSSAIGIKTEKRSGSGARNRFNRLNSIILAASNSISTTLTIMSSLLAVLISFNNVLEQSRKGFKPYNRDNEAIINFNQAIMLSDSEDDFNPFPSPPSSSYDP
jgi:hypothetical protein